MSMLYIGAGGWAYFRVPGMDPLAAYAKAFNFVEVNSTFYTTPSIEMVSSWRRRVPPDFMFSVRCHQDLTHKYFLTPLPESHEILHNSIRICNELRAEILHIQTPASFDPHEKLKDIIDLISSFNFGKIRLAWEIRGPITPETIELMHDLGIIHCTDISKEMPDIDSDILYARIFGRGEHNLYQFDDTEMQQIDERVKEKSRGKAYLTFHGVKMYMDAARLKVYENSISFPNLTKSTGLASLRSVLEEDAKFPATKSALIEKQVWKVFDISDAEHVHASKLLEKLPDRRYVNVEDVIEALK
jgi:uncharacterized protein YecE (DUF72 family)